MRDELENRSLTGAGNRSGMGTGAIAAIIAAIIVVALPALWHPWTSSEPRAVRPAKRSAARARRIAQFVRQQRQERLAGRRPAPQNDQLNSGRRISKLPNSPCHFCKNAAVRLGGT